MPSKKTTSEDTGDLFITTPATPAVSQLAEIDAQIAALTAQKKATRLAETERRAQEREAKRTAAILTLDEVIARQIAYHQKWVVETIAGRVMARTKAGQDQETAMRDVLAQMETRALEEIQRRQTSK